MKIVIKNSLLDLMAFGKHLKIREKLFSTASSEPKSEGKANILSRQLHPDTQDLIIEDVIEESHDMWSFILRPVSEFVKIAPFRAGQYLVLSFEEDGLILKRPYSIASSPSESNTGNFYRISIKRKTQKMDGYFSDSVFRNWKKGFLLNASGPQGNFYYDSIRDANTLVCIAGGSGITPFRSIIPDLLNKQSELKILLFYGFNTDNDDVFSSDFKAYAKEFTHCFSYFPLAMDSQGVLSSTMIKEALKQNPDVNDENRKDTSFFICGPPALHNHIDRELNSFSLRPKFIRRESFGLGTDNSNKVVNEYKLLLNFGDENLELKALSSETILTALERGGVNAPSSCRTGECGWCRSLLLSGEISVDQGLTGIRQADKKFGWIHPCVSYPLSNIELRVPENPVKVVK